jgi:hypothetical protein
MSSVPSISPPPRRIVAVRPYDVAKEAWLCPRRQERLIWTFIALALVARAVRFLLCFPLWEDECFLVSNFIDRSYGDLLQPLNYHQVAPVLFLWLELTAVKVFGFHEWSLRLFPFLGAAASLLLFRHFAGRLLHGPARLLAVAAFCASYSGIRYAAEAKPYGLDQLASLVLLVLAAEWWHGRRSGWLAVLIGLVPLAVGLSYPAVFVAGGVSVFMAAIICREGRRGWLGWIAYNIVLVTSFLLLLRITEGQSDAELSWMQDYWKDHLPTLAAPLEFVLWFFKTHTGNLLAIPLGGERGASIVSFLLVAAGITRLVRSKQYELMLLCVTPAALNLVAALMERFPYGGHVKFSQYLAPAICLLLGTGGAALLSSGTDAVLIRRRKLFAALIVLACIPLGTMARDFALPYKSPTDARYRDFARWFWPSMQFGGETACLQTDLGLEFAPGTFHHLGWSAMYLCNQRIYSPRHHRGEPIDWSRVSDTWPLHCVEYRAQVYRYDEAASRAWLASMGERYRLVSRDVFPSPVFDQRGRNLLCADRLVIYKFISK